MSECVDRLITGHMNCEEIHTALHFPAIKVASEDDTAGLAIGIRHEPPLEVDNEIAYILQYDPKYFDLVLSYDTMADFSVPDRVHLIFNKDTSDHVLRVSHVHSSIMEVTLERREKGGGPVSQEYSVNLAYGMKPFSVSVAQFQELQTQLTHSTLLDVSASGCSFEDLLAEVLNRLRMTVVLDRQTTFSRTCWLSGRIVNEPVLIVLDGLRRGSGDRVSVDAWSRLDRIDEAILEVIAETRIGEVQSDFSGLKVQWAIEKSETEKAVLTVSVSSNSERKVRTENPVFFTVDYQGLLTESFETMFSSQQQQVTITADLSDVRASWNGQLTEPYITVYLSDGRWKNMGRSYPIVSTWKQALEQQIRYKLSTGNRFRSVDEFSASLNMTGEGESALQLFTSFCLDLELKGCGARRVVDYCGRAAVITCLVACFDPSRGIPGYLDMLAGPHSPKVLEELGSRRTWRNHISQIAQACNIFAPKTAKLAIRNKDRSPGRPPTHLTPTIRPLELFQQLLDSPENVVCKDCRFYRT